MANELIIPASFSNAQTQQALAELDPNWQQVPDNFSAGIRLGFGVVSLKGKVWRIVYQGVSKPIMRPDNPQEAVATLPVIMVDAGAGISKVFYKDGYVDGNDNPPDCFSHDGVKPDASVAKPQCGSCAICPQNVFGSKMTEQGKPTKACADSKRIAVVPLPPRDNPNMRLSEDDLLDILENGLFGGPMLLRVPAASMSGLATYSKGMLDQGFPLHAIGTNLSFDIEAPYPRIMFNPVRPLTKSELEIVYDMRGSDLVKQMLAAGAGVAEPGMSEVAANVATNQPQPPPAAAPTPVPAPQPAPTPPTPAAAPVAPTPAPAAATTNGAAATPTVAASRRGRRAAGATTTMPTQQPQAAQPEPTPVATPTPAPVMATPAPAPVAQAAPAASSGDLDDVLDGLFGDDE